MSDTAFAKAKKMSNKEAIDIGQIAEFTLKNFPAGYAGVIPIEVELEEGDLWVDDPEGYEAILDNKTVDVVMTTADREGAQVKIFAYSVDASDFPLNEKKRYVVYINNKTKELQYRLAIKLIIESNESNY